MHAHNPGAYDRPGFHFTSLGWINDPHAITYERGRYHSFFQFVPDSTEWSPACHWGHAAGGDLFSLIDLPPALSPGEGDDGVWSGSLAFDADGEPVILYTSVSDPHLADGRVRTARPVDADWMEWRKGDVVAAAPEGHGITAFRDPSVFKDGDVWRMVVGAGTEDSAAAAVGFTSTDALRWHPDGVMTSRRSADRDPVWTGSMWECPQIIEVDGRHVLIVSVWDDDVLYDVVYALGDYAAGEFRPGTWRTLSFGPAPYAATAFHDASEAPCVMFWLRGIHGEGWTGAHSVPYRLSIVDDDLRLAPHPDLDRYVDQGAASGIAADIHWPDSADDLLEIIDETGIALRFERTHEFIRVRAGATQHVIPRQGDVRLIIDGPVLEAVSAAGVFGAPIRRLGEGWRVDCPGAETRFLSRRQVAGPGSGDRVTADEHARQESLAR